MAIEAPVNFAPPERSPVVSTAADSFAWQPGSLRMHVIRPKSAKGRKRPNLHRPQGMGEGSPSVRSSPPPPRSSGSPNNQKPRVCATVPPSQGAPDEMPEVLQQAPIRTASSLNRYPVLPSINRRTLEDGAVDTVASKTSSLQLSSIQALYQEEARATGKSSQEDSGTQVCAALEKKFTIRTKRRSSSRASDMEEPSEEEPRLLLAVRSPSGQRFVRYFRPSDDLQTVLEVAEQKNKATYQHCSIETMEVPRRRFSDLTKSLQECGILHKSVLGISKQEGEGWP